MKNIHKDSRGIIHHLGLFLLLVVILGVVGLAGFKVYSGRNAKAAAGGTFLAQGECLNKGQSIYNSKTVSSTRKKLTMQYDGNLTIKNSSGSILWSTKTNVPNSRACMQTDGNFVVYTPDNKAVWNTGTWGIPASTYYKLYLRFTGNTSNTIAIMSISTNIMPTETDRGETFYWMNSYGDRINLSGVVIALTPGRTGRELMPKGTKLVSQNGKYTFEFQTDGVVKISSSTANKVLCNCSAGQFFGVLNENREPFGVGPIQMAGMAINRSSAVWSVQSMQNTSLEAYYTNEMYLVMQDDGNLVVYNYKNNPLWWSGSIAAAPTISCGSDPYTKPYNGQCYTLETENQSECSQYQGTWTVGPMGTACYTIKPAV